MTASIARAIAIEADFTIGSREHSTQAQEDSVAVNKTIQMVNIYDKPVTIELGASPGDGTTEFVIAPGEAQAFHENFCKEVPGAGRNFLPSILERMSTRTWADGVRRPTLVPASEAPRLKREFTEAVNAWVKAGRPAAKPDAPERSVR